MRHPNYPAPPHSFALWLDDDMALRLRERHDARDLYQRAVRDKSHLARWFGWAREFDDDSIDRQVKKGLEQFVAGDGWHADLFWRGEPIGALWLHYLDREGGSTEVGYWLAAEHEGKGLITRAVQGLLRHFFVERRLGRVAIAFDPRNERSQAVAVRLGLAPEAVLRRAVLDADGAPGDLAFYGMLEDEWQAAGGDDGGLRSRRSPPRFAMCIDAEEELYLAVFEREDAEELARLVTANEAHLGPWMPWVTAPRPASQLAFIENRALRAFVTADGFECAIMRGGKIVGAAGVHDVNTRSRRGSIGYWIDKEEQGKGFVTKAVAAILARSFTVGVIAGEPFERLDVFAEVDNLKSRAVHERLGFTFEGVLRRHRHNGSRYADFAVYSLLRGEYLQAQDKSSTVVEEATVERAAVAARRKPMPRDKRREAVERQLDDALDDTFPASDPPSHDVSAKITKQKVRKREAALDDALDDSFTASDPPSHTPPRAKDS